MTDTEGPKPDTGPSWPRWIIVLWATIALASVVGRFFIRTPMWLDEALTVDIARRPLGQIPALLKHDGHPPLFYWLLHVWMQIFGRGTLAVRALPAFLSILGTPLAFWAGRTLAASDTKRHSVELGCLTAGVWLVSPFVFENSTQARMYSLVMVLVLAGYLAARSLRRRPSIPTAALCCVIGIALLWTHYWGIWVIASVGLLTLCSMARSVRSRTGIAPGDWWLLGAVAVSGIGFLPWLPTFLFQLAHTGTPWAARTRPTAVVTATLNAATGGSSPELQLFGLLLAGLVVVGIFGNRQRRVTVLAMRPQADAMLPLALLAAIAVLASVAGFVAGSTFVARYASAFFPFVVMLVALGLARLPQGHPRSVVTVAFLGLSLVGLGYTATAQRSQAGEVARAVATLPSSTLVVACPDQLGPSIRRAIPPKIQVVRYPDLGPPLYVNWVDYAKRNARNDPAAFVTKLTKLAGGRPIAVAFAEGHPTLRGQCTRVLELLGAEHPGRVLVTGRYPHFFEPVWLEVFGG